MTLIAKVCGITSRQDAQMAIAAGADLIGFVRYPESPRHCVDINEASQNVGGSGVLVCVTENLNDAIDEALAYGLGWVQPYVPATQRRDAMTRANDAGLKLLLPWPDRPHQDAASADMYLWETAAAQTGVHGGSGQTHDALYPPPGPFLLAGGLDGDNVAERINALPREQRFQCRGADAASRLEASPGVKSIPKTQFFTRAIHAI